jgi:multidrug resistance protein MdtO
VGKQIDSALAAVLRDLSAMVRSTDPASRLTLAARVQGALGGIEQNLDLARYEPTTIRPSENWLRIRHTAVHEIGVLQGPLLLSAIRNPASGADAARRLEQSARLIETETQVEGLETSLTQVKSMALETADHVRN